MRLLEWSRIRPRHDVIGKRKYIRQQLRNHPGANPKYYAACYGKLRRTKEAAHEEASHFSTMAAYKCKYCSWYHVGRKPENTRKSGR